MTRLAFATALLALAAPAAAEQFTLLVYETPEALALRDAPGPAGAAYWASYGDFAAAATEAGVLRGGAPLSAGGDVVTVSASGLAETAFAEAPLALGGYFQIDVPDRAEALAWARRLPASSAGAVEIRAGYPAPAM